MLQYIVSYFDHNHFKNSKDFQDQQLQDCLSE